MDLEHSIHGGKPNQVVLGRRPANASPNLHRRVLDKPDLGPVERLVQSHASLAPRFRAAPGPAIDWDPQRMSKAMKSPRWWPDTGVATEARQVHQHHVVAVFD